jgi:small subunit ribosomal protein S11
MRNKSTNQTKTAKKSKNAIGKITTGQAKVYVTATFNNTLITFTNMVGEAICWGSSGSAGFKGARKSTPYAATIAVDQIAKKAIAIGVKEVEVYIKGPGMGRDASLRALRTAGLKINLIADVTPMPHNGPRPPKPRRV